MRRSGPLLRSVLLTLVAGGGVAALSLAGGLRPFDLPVGDLLLRLRAAVGAPAPADAPVVAVVLDDASLDAVGPLPWPREHLATLLDAIHARGGRAIALDLVLNEPGDPTGDAALARSLGRGPAVLAAALRRGGGWLLPLQELGGAGRAAHAEAEVGPDGVVRTLLATKQRLDLALPALSLAAARLVRPELPVTPGAALHPDFRLPPARVPRLSALELLALPANGEPVASPDLLRGRVVFVGTTATAASDQFLVPTGGAPAPGVLIHASAAASVLAGGTVAPPHPALLLAACLLLAGLAQLGRGHAGRLRLVHFLAVGLGLVAAGAGAILLAGTRLPLVTLAAAFGGSALLREAAESARAQRDTGRLLGRLLRESAPADGASTPAPGAGPRGAAGRLDLARELQERVIRDRNLRRALLDALEDGVVRWGADGRVELANAAAATLWGGRPPDREEVVAALSEGAPQSTSGQGDETLAVEGALVRREGREIRVLLRPLEDAGSRGGPGSPVDARADAPGSAPGTLGVLRDVTAERELESRRREMQRMVSHELKTPLASIASFGSMLERYELSDEELARLAGLIRGESERLLAMVTTFLDLERIGGGRWGGEREPVDLAALAAERIEILRAAAEPRGIEIVLEAPEALRPDGPDACRVTGDRELLGRVVDNLVGNAVKYSPEGERVAVRVRRTDAPDGEVELAVADRGPGIPPESQEHLFERFYRVPGRRGATDEPAGSGLGLALVREIAQWHGGCVFMETEPARGSVFTVRIPAGAPPEP